ncbi:DUF4873 domain-containing protein [Williamsia herbipolensis]|uniref:DUF4873 domain-containing protein n=1 Tax=Williamsia herbipolensis TaxID=1603258 RepID=UPI0005F7CFA0|nr:DUF4873 domain-containing protein [Williamsia herbipolensis]
MSDDHDLDYSGEAVLACRGKEIPVDLKIKGYFQPLNGLYTWYGRIAKNAELDAVLQGKRTVAVVSTPEGRAECVVGDVDFWGRYRLSGKSRPPYHVPSTLEEVEAIAESEHHS